MQRLGFSTSGRGEPTPICKNIFQKYLYHHFIIILFLFQENKYWCFLQGRSPHRAEEDGEQAAGLQSWTHLGTNNLIT